MSDAEDKHAFRVECESNRRLGQMRLNGLLGKETKEEILKYHRWTRARQLRAEERDRKIVGKMRCIDIPGGILSRGWCNNRSPKALESLEEIRIEDLQLGKTHKHCVVWGQICEESQFNGAIYTIMESLDHPDTIVRISFHSGISSKTCAEAEEEFPIGARIGIQEPLLKVYGDGTTGIRVDNMQHVFGDVCHETVPTRKTRDRWTPGRACVDSNCHGVCQHCGKQGTPQLKLQKCSGCNITHYCSAHCQKRQWRQHKLVCLGREDGFLTRPRHLDIQINEGLYCVDSDFKALRQPLSTTPQRSFYWSKELWALSPPEISDDGCIATNRQYETLFCSATPFGSAVTLCQLRLLEKAGSASIGLCLIKDGKISTSWRYSTHAEKDYLNKKFRYGEPFDVGDIMGIVFTGGALSFRKNGKDLGVCFAGLDSSMNYYIRCSLASNGPPEMPTLEMQGAMEILQHTAVAEKVLVPGVMVCIVALVGRPELNGRIGYIARGLSGGRHAVFVYSEGNQISLHSRNLELASSTEVKEETPSTHSLT